MQRRDHQQQHDEAARVAAATLIQRLWRRQRSKYLNTDARWKDALSQARFEVDRAAAMDGRNSPPRRWRRAVFLIGRLRDKDDFLQQSGYPAEAELKHLETQHWLELIDGGIINGGNRKTPRRTSSNGSMKEAANIYLLTNVLVNSWKEKYLSAEQRLKYLVKIDDQGKLLWAKNNQPVDTTPGHWMDANDGRGIVPMDLNRASEVSRARRRQWDDSSSSVDSAQANHYVGPTPGRAKWVTYLRQYLTLRGMMDRLLRRTVRRNTWIYVSDKHFNIFVGIKDTGAFQHSSFTSGGLVTSAGLISVKQGLIHTLSPLSGHYRTSVNHFHRFIDILGERGVDMRKAKISKAEVALWGIEHIAKFKKWQSGKVVRGKDSVKEVVSKVIEPQDERNQWKAEILRGRNSQVNGQDNLPGLAGGDNKSEREC